MRARSSDAALGHVVARPYSPTTARSAASSASSAAKNSVTASLESSRRPSAAIETSSGVGGGASRNKSLNSSRVNTRSNAFSLTTSVYVGTLIAERARRSASGQLGDRQDRRDKPSAGCRRTRRPERRPSSTSGHSTDGRGGQHHTPPSVAGPPCAESSPFPVTPRDHPKAGDGSRRNRGAARARSGVPNRAQHPKSRGPDADLATRERRPPAPLKSSTRCFWVGLARIELATSSLSGMRSNRLSYSPVGRPTITAGHAGGPVP